MFIGNLMASVLALAMVGASTASASNVENNTLGSDVVLNRDLHKAYYDPAGTYGDDVGRFYNYSSYSFHQWDADPGDDSNGFLETPCLNPSVAGSFENNYRSSRHETWIVIYDEDDQEIGIDFILEDGNGTPVFDLYKNGEFVASFTSHEEMTSSDVAVNIYSFEYEDNPQSVFESTDYLWVFDHGTLPEPYTPVDILGDIAEGLTGGIVPVAEGIGSGLQSLVQDIFLNDPHDGLSVFGIVIICFAGLALALGLSRWVLNFVDTLGARDR